MLTSPCCSLWLGAGPGNFRGDGPRIRESPAEVDIRAPGAQSLQRGGSARSCVVNGFVSQLSLLSGCIHVYVRMLCFKCSLVCAFLCVCVCVCVCVCARARVLSYNFTCAGTIETVYLFTYTVCVI